MSKNTIKICDFGMSRTWEKTGTDLMTVCGTPLYMAPELICNRRGSNKVNFICLKLDAKFIIL